MIYIQTAEQQFDVLVYHPVRVITEVKLYWVTGLYCGLSITHTFTITDICALFKKL